MTQQNVIQINGGITINDDASMKKHYICEKEYAWIPSTCICEHVKYLAGIMDDLAIICDEVIEADAKLSLNNNGEERKIIPTNQPVKR